MKRKIKLLKFAVIVLGLAIISLCLTWLPQMAERAALYNPEIAFMKTPVLWGIYLTTVPFYYALSQAFALLNIIGRNESFSEASLRALNHIKISAISIVLLYLSGLTVLGVLKILHPSILIIVSIVIFSSLCVVVFSDILHALIKKGNAIQSENDLTV